MDSIIKQWAEWKKGKDEGYIYDECSEFLSQLSRGEICSFLDELESLFSYDKMKMCSILLIKMMCIDTNADTAKLEQTITYKGTKVGRYKITIQKCDK